MTEEQLRALLRVKRYEQPPPGYFDQLLRDIHRRQRAELLRRPLWKIAFERMQTYFGEHSMSPASYAGAMATLLIMGIGVIGLVTPGGSDSGSGSRPTGGATLLTETETPVGSPAQPSRSFTLGPSLQDALQDARAFTGWEMPFPRPASSGVQIVRHPRYVIDARPAVYEAPSSF